MAKLFVMHQEPLNKEKFDEHYFNKHIPLVKQIPNVKNISVQEVRKTKNTELNLYVIVELEFDNMEILNQSMSSDQAQKVFKDGKNLKEFISSPSIQLITE